MSHTDGKQEKETSRFSILLGIVGVVLFAVFIVMDVLTPLCFDAAWSAVFMMNIVIGQLTLICIWGTLVEGTFWFRLPWTILLLVVSWGALCYGVSLDTGSISSAEVLGMGLVWFYGFIVSYIPLKLAAWLFGWRISQESILDADNESNRYAIRDIMVGTAILAVALAIGRLLIPGELPAWSTVLDRSRLDEPTVLFALFLFSIISLIVKLPCIWIALAISKEKILGYSLVWVFCSGLMGVVELGILYAAISEPRGSEFYEFIFGLVFGHAAMAVVMIGVLCTLRCFGYRMSRLRRESVASAA